MKKKTIVILCLAAALIVLGAAVCALAVGMGAQPKELFREGAYVLDLNERGGDFGEREGNFGERPGDVSAEMPMGENNYSVGCDIGRIEIDWVRGNVKIVKGEGDSITFSESRDGGIDAEDRLVYEIDDNTLKISCCDDIVTIGFNFDSGCGDKELIVTVPENMTDISVDTTSADVVLEGLGVKDGIRASTTSGDISISGAGCEKGILSTTSGNIDFNGSCKDFAADAVSGRISFVGSCRDFEADSTSGKVEAVFADTPNEISADTVSGAVELTLPSDAAFELEFDTVSGGFDCDFAVKMHDGDYVAGSGGAEIDVDTVSGGLKIKSK